MSTIIPTIAATDRASESRAAINAAFRDRHSLDITEIDDGDSPYTALDTDQLVIADASAGAITVALPPAASFTNRSLYVVALDVTGGNVTINPDGAETIDGLSTKVLSAAYASCRVVSTGSEWIAL